MSGEEELAGLDPDLLQGLTLRVFLSIVRNSMYLKMARGACCPASQLLLYAQPAMISIRPKSRDCETEQLAFSVALNGFPRYFHAATSRDFNLL